MSFDSDPLDQIEGLHTSIDLSYYNGKVAESFEANVHSSTATPIEIGFVEDALMLKVNTDTISLTIGPLESPSDLRGIANWFDTQADNWEEYQDLVESFEEQNNLDAMDLAELREKHPRFSEVWDMPTETDE